MASKLTFDTKLDPNESAKYFDEVGAPILFERMASELLRMRPSKEEVGEVLVAMLMTEKAKTLAGDAGEESLRVFKLLTGDEEESVSWDKLLLILNLDESSVDALIPGLKPEDDVVTVKEWNSWLAGCTNTASLLGWIESRRMDNPADGWTPEIEERVSSVFSKIDSLLDWNGEVDKQELLSVLKQTPLAAKVLFSELDCNSDGGVSVSEWTSWFKGICVKNGPGASLDRLEWIEESLEKVAAERVDNEAKTLHERGLQLNTQLNAIAEGLAR